MAVAQSPSIILSFEQARRLIDEHAAGISTPQAEEVALLDAFGRVLAEDVVADRDLPPFRRSTRDGYAVVSSDLAKVPALVEVIGEIKAGERVERIPKEVASCQAVAIMTGAPVPAGADAVVMVEYTARSGNRVEISRAVSAGENIVPAGAEARLGSTLVQRGTDLNYAAIALAASVGKSRLRVYQRPHVAVLTTGDEIVALDAVPGPTEIRNSNSYSLAVQIRNAGGEPVMLPIAPDQLQALGHLIEQGFESDLLLMTGGVSMGRYDLVEQALTELKAEFFFTGARIQPGRPVVFGRRGGPEKRVAKGTGGLRSDSYFLGLPGNPVSTMVTFELFARPLLEALAGRRPRKLTFVHAKLKSDIRIKTGLTRFLPAMLSGEFENSEVELVPWQGSGDIAATARANCYIVILPERDRIPAGEFVPILMR